MALSDDPRTDPFAYLAQLNAAENDSNSKALMAQAARQAALMGRLQASAPASPVTGGGSAPVNGSLQNYARAQFAKYGWGANEWSPLFSLWQKESGWNPTAKNPSSGAYGIPQALPSNKLPRGEMSTGQQQIDWGLQYIKQRYGDPAAAWGHSQQTNWY